MRPARLIECGGGGRLPAELRLHWRPPGAEAAATKPALHTTPAPSCRRCSCVVLPSQDERRPSRQHVLVQATWRVMLPSFSMRTSLAFASTLSRIWPGIDGVEVFEVGA